MTIRGCGNELAVLALAMGTAALMHLDDIITSRQQTSAVETQFWKIKSQKVGFL